MSSGDAHQNTNSEAALEAQISKLLALAKPIPGSTTQQRERFRCLEEGIEYLRLIIRYQTYDLEATRRENEDLKVLLDYHGGNPS